MKKTLKWFFIVGLITLVGIQFIPADVNKQEVTSSSDIRHVYDVPDNVMNILETSCYDCHSNNTNYPWYSKVQPVRLLMDKHIREGKKELNFSEFGSYSERRKRNKIQSIGSQIEDGEMPLSSYLMIHDEAKISNSDKEVLAVFLNNLAKD